MYSNVYENISPLYINLFVVLLVNTAPVYKQLHGINTTFASLFGDLGYLCDDGTPITSR